MKNKIIVRENMKELVDFIKDNKYYIGLIIFVGILSYNFAITHYSMGVDDEAIQRFIIEGESLAQRRAGLFLINKIFGIAGFVPGWRDILATMCLVVSALLLPM